MKKKELKQIKKEMKTLKKANKQLRKKVKHLRNCVIAEIAMIRDIAIHTGMMTKEEADAIENEAGLHIKVCDSHSNERQCHNKCCKSTEQHCRCGEQHDKELFSDEDLKDFLAIVEALDENLEKGIEVDRVKFNGPATIVQLTNGEKIVTKCKPGDQYDKEKGLAFALLRACGMTMREFYELLNHAEGRGFGL